MDELPRSNESRRERMLEALKRATTLKEELRKKYGEFDIDSSIEESRRERLEELERNLDLADEGKNSVAYD